MVLCFGFNNMGLCGPHTKTIFRDIQSDWRIRGSTAGLRPGLAGVRYQVKDVKLSESYTQQLVQLRHGEFATLRRSQSAISN